MRVMQVIGSGDAGGAETCFLRLVTALGRSCAVLPVVRDGAWVAGELAAEGFLSELAPFGGRLDLRTRPAIARAAASFRPQVIQYWMNRDARFAPRDGAAVSVGRLGGYYDLRYYRAMDYLVGNTRDIVDHAVAQGWPRPRVRYLPNFAPVPPGNFRAARAAERARLGLPAEAFVLLAAGRLHEAKGLDLLLAALAGLTPEVHLLLAGAGPREPDLRALAARAGLAERVRFLGWWRELAPLAAAADLWVVPSREEPLGNVVLDAWAHGLPVLATRTQGPEALIADGATGLLVATEDAAVLGAAIARLQDDAALRGRLAAAGQARVQAEFSAEAVLAQTLAFYREIAAVPAPEEA